MKVIIKRSKWLRGDPEESYLLRPSDKKMCCLGFRCLAVGLKKSDILEQYSPGDVADKLPDGDWTVSVDDNCDSDSADAVVAMGDNDNEDITDEERERRITEIFLRNGDEAIFVD